MKKLESIDQEELRKMLEGQDYIADDQTVMSVFLALRLKKPLLLEGEPGCGKTELAKVLSRALNTELIRLQCYEGLDANSAVYEWDYMRQLMKIKIEESRKRQEDLEKEVFNERFLLKRPLLNAVLHQGETPSVLLIDEIDRADEEFEGYLLEFLAEYQVTVPEIGTLKAKHEPIVILTSNRTRELGEGLRRRCIYHYLTYPPADKELQIVRRKVPGIEDAVSKKIISVIEKIREMKTISKKPGVSETITWAEAVGSLNSYQFTRDFAESTLGCIIKSSDELGHSREALSEFFK